MTNTELRKKLRKAGWVITSGGAHDQAKNLNYPGVKIAIPRHKGDIPKGTANSILKEAGLK
ncbi:MAG: type II toxin-antitoxin system HicA family toxin [Oscillospiraceae bacterium]|nr:type II toxin-antitoxin system HicA family toxin [Oscillospiraceae bacterium]